MSAGIAALPVSNPMNMVVAEFSHIGFNTYAHHMIPIAVLGWVIAYALLRVIFFKELSTPVMVIKYLRTKSTKAQRWMMLLLVTVLLFYPVMGYLNGPYGSLRF